MTGDIGGRLQRAREHRGLSLADIARRTRLPLRVLQAIEGNDFARLPAGMFRKAYLRTLAIEVGLDPNEIAADYQAQFEPATETPAVIARTPAVENEWVEQLTQSPRRSRGTLAVLAAAAAIWFWLQPGPRQTMLPAHDTVDTTAAMPSRPGSASAPPGPAVLRRASTPPVNAAGRPAAPLSIALQATGWCWVAAETDGERVLYRLVKPGEHLVLEAQRVISMRLGDAGSVMLSINDGVSRSFGGQGDVIEFELTTENVGSFRDGGVDAASDARVLPTELAPQ